jgi:hypothetical protein
MKGICNVGMKFNMMRVRLIVLVACIVITAFSYGQSVGSGKAGHLNARELANALQITNEKDIEIFSSLMEKQSLADDESKTLLLEKSLKEGTYSVSVTRGLMVYLASIYASEGKRDEAIATVEDIKTKWPGKQTDELLEAVPLSAVSAGSQSKEFVEYLKKYRGTEDANHHFQIFLQDAKSVEHLDDLIPAYFELIEHTSWSSDLDMAVLRYMNEYQRYSAQPQAYSLLQKYYDGVPQSKTSVPVVTKLATLGNFVRGNSTVVLALCESGLALNPNERMTADLLLAKSAALRDAGNMDEAKVVLADVQEIARKNDFQDLTEIIGLLKTPNHSFGAKSPPKPTVPMAAYIGGALAILLAAGVVMRMVLKKKDS